jgi:deoxyribonuclease-4
MLKIGCHLSSAGGFTAMGKTAVSIGANVFQFFTRNPRGGAAKAIDPADIDRYRLIAQDNGLQTILAHAPYTINCCAAKENTRQFAIETMADDMKRMEYVPGNLYNFHPGSHVGQGKEKGIEMIAQVLNMIIMPEQSTTILLETMAGKGTEVGSKFEELSEIINMVKYKEKLGVCLDTCHVYDAGYDIVNDLDGVLSEFDCVIGLGRLKAIHVNDSKNPFQSHKDRHEKIGLGSIGTDAIARIINHPKLRDLPFYLETPNELEGYAQEIALLKSLYIE